MKLLHVQAAASGWCVATHNPASWTTVMASLDDRGRASWIFRLPWRQVLSASWTRRNNVWNLTGRPIWRCSELEGWRNSELGPNPGRAVPLGIHTICSHLLSLSCRFRNMLTAFAVTSWGRLYAQRNARHPNCISNSRNESMPLATALLKTVNKKYRGECIIQKQQASPSEIRIHLKSS